MLKALNQRAVHWALTQNTGSAADKLVLIVLAAQADERAYVRPARDELSAATHLDRKTIARAMRRLRLAGLIVDTGERAGPTGNRRTYLLPLERKPSSQPWMGQAVPPLSPRRRAEAYAELVQRDGEFCHYCGARGVLVIDHFRPRSRGGTNRLDNLRLSCPRCNVAKGNLPPENWHP
jgi:5-methylcytosine-specific restriction endonuclease McrA